MRIVILCLIVVATAIFSEWLTTSHPEPGPVHIVYWEKWTDFEGDAIRAVVNEFNRSQKKIHVDLLTVSGIEDKTLMSVAAGIPPDVAGLYGANTAQYVDDRAIISLDDYCKKAGIRRENYVPPFWDMGFYDGHMYALPSAPATTALHFNKDMLRAAGADPNNPPQTIEELTALSDKITTKNKDGSIDVSGFIPAEPGWWNWGWGYYFGGKLWDGKSKITANSPENIRAFEWVQSFSKKYGPSAVQTFRSGFGAFSSPQNAFLSRKVAMEMQGVWMYNFITRFSPDLKWGASPFPHPADRPDLANTTFADEDILVIPRGAKHPDEAFEFIKFVESQKGMEILCLQQRKQSPLVKVSDGFYTKHPNPFVKLFANQGYSPNAVKPPQVGIWPEYTAELTNAFDIVNLMQATPKEALDQVQQRMQPKLDEYLERLRARREKGL